jgi:hypothetical protein
MRRRCLPGLVLGVTVLATHSTLSLAEDEAPVAPTDFAFGMKFETRGNAAAFRAPLPTEVYRGLTRRDLLDVAVFNGAGEVVPHALAAALAPSDATAAAMPLPVFPLRGNDQAVMEALRVTIESGGGGKLDLALPEARSVAQAGAAGAAIRGYIVDGRAITSPVATFQIGWAEDAPEFAGRVRVEGSDNLGDWRVLVDAAPVANLRAGEAKLAERRIELRPARANYWRLSWVGGDAPFEITSVSAEVAAHTPQIRRPTLALEGQAVKGKAGEFEFDAGGAFPVDRVNLELPELNSVVDVELLSRNSSAQPWRRVTRTGFYRLQGTDAELVNGDVRILPTSDRYWLVRVDARNNGLGGRAPKLRIAWPPHEVVFLARGQGPFTLAFGNGALSAAVGRIASIPAGARILDASLGEREILGGESRLASASARAPGKSMVLWAVLGFGVALLAFMAYRLSRELKRAA